MNTTEKEILMTEAQIKEVEELLSTLNDRYKNLKNKLDLLYYKNETIKLSQKKQHYNVYRSSSLSPSPRHASP